MIPPPLDVLGVVTRMVIAPRVPVTSTTAPARQIFPQPVSVMTLLFEVYWQ
ncbi:hypothetical protein SF285071_0689 [Shigella flexneri 2850-71]|nr:hypothetical protein SF285071_0689 [Shigella flexneri 2850-71]